MAAVVTNLGINVVTASGTETVVATPALGDLIVILTCYTGNVTNTLPTDNNTDGHGTYELVVAALKNTSADRLAFYVRSQSIQRAVSTTFSLAPGTTTGGGLSVFKITGMTIAGPSAIRQSASQANAAAGTPAPAFPVAALTANAVIGAVFNATNPAAMTPPTSWTEQPTPDTGYATPTTGLESAIANSGITSTTVTWGSASATAFSAVILELDTRGGQTSIFPPRGSGALDNSQDDSPKLQAVKRAAFYMQGWQKRRSGLIAPEPGILVPA